MEEIFGLTRCWYMGDGPREQTISQNMAEQQFDWYLEQMKRAGVTVSPIKRSLRITKDNDGVDIMAYYFQRVKVEGSEEAIQQLKAQFNKR